MVGGLLQGRGGREGVGGDWGLLQGAASYGWAWYSFCQ